MTRRREAEPLSKVTLNIYRSDYERLQAHYSSVGVGKAIRAILRAHVQKLAAHTASVDESILDEIELEFEDD